MLTPTQSDALLALVIIALIVGVIILIERNTRGD